ncbi:MAG: hypothetical protein Q8P52_02375 [bacterium]|nr:hypothetical protein [bacterium]
MQKPLEWKTHEYRFRKKTADWYWAVGIITIALAATAVILNNLLFAFVIILGSFSLAMYASRPPKEISCSISSTGVYAGGLSINAEELISFWIEFGDRSPRLILKTKHMLSPIVTIQMEGVEADEVKNMLSKYAKEEELHEPLTQQIMEYLGF